MSFFKTNKNKVVPLGSLALIVTLALSAPAFAEIGQGDFQVQAIHSDGKTAVAGHINSTAAGGTPETPTPDPENPQFIVTLDSTAPGCTDPGVNVAAPLGTDVTAEWQGQSVKVANTVTKTLPQTPGEFQVTFTGTGAAFRSNINVATASCLKSVDKWDSGFTATAENAFKDARNLTSVIKPPSNINNMSRMFQGASSFNQDISDWDVSNVTNMSSMFERASAFNNGGEPLDWGVKVGKVKFMDLMFQRASSFNQDISDWDVSNVTNMSSMFLEAASFNQDLSAWDVSNVVDMNGMFVRASAFNQDLSAWDVSSVTIMGVMFYYATAFNQDLSDWDVSNVTDMSSMFERASAFNNGGEPLDWGVKVGKVKNMSRMFQNATSFNQDLSAWDVSNVVDMSSMFERASAFNQDLSGWDVSRVTLRTDFAIGSPLASQTAKLPQFR